MSGADRSASARPLDRPVHHASPLPSSSSSSSSRPAGQHVQSSSAVPTTSSADSWVEVSSRASSSSLSSVPGDDIVTTGLRIQNVPTAQRRRRTTLSGAPLRLYMAGVAAARRGEATSSSQDEYEESGSESDRILTSSNEGLSGPASEAHSISNRAPASATSADTEEDESNLEDDDGDEDEDESATALGVNNQACFTPQPNAFSHPPSSSSYFNSHSTARPQPRSRHQSFTARTARQSHSPLSSSHHADHDAALRASLSTLLSCAAAARGLPKAQQQSSVQRQPQSANRVEPRTLRMVPESALKSVSPRPRSSSSSSSSRSADKKDQSRRKSASRSSSKERAHAAKRAAQLDVDITGVSPTLLTWVVSAGVLVLVSALSFGAGYSTGREAGRVEAGFLDPTPTVAEGCGRGAVLRGSSGLRRLRWTDAASAVVAGA